MPRKGHTLHRDVLADPVYNSKLVTKLIGKDFGVKIDPGC